MAEGAHAHPHPDHGPSLGDDGAQHALVLTALRGDHDLGEAPAEVFLDGEPVHVREGLVEVEVAQILVEDDQADGAGREERVEEGEVGLHPVQFVAAAGQHHDDRTLFDAGHREDPEPAVEVRPVPVPGEQPAAPVALGPPPRGHTGAGAGLVFGGVGEEYGAGLRQHIRGLVAEEVVRAGAPVADPVLVIDAEYGDGHVFQQGAGLRPERTTGIRVTRPICWHHSSARSASWLVRPPDGRAGLFILRLSRIRNTSAADRRRCRVAAPGAHGIASPEWLGPVAGSSRPSLHRRPDAALCGRPVRASRRAGNQAASAETRPASTASARAW